jgi:hypothetical protein
MTIPMNSVAETTPNGPLISSGKVHRRNLGYFEVFFLATKSI